MRINSLLLVGRLLTRLPQPIVVDADPGAMRFADVLCLRSLEKFGLLGLNTFAAATRCGFIAETRRE